MCGCSGWRYHVNLDGSPIDGAPTFATRREARGWLRAKGYPVTGIVMVKNGG